MFIDENYDSDQDAQIHMFIIGNYIEIILKVIGPIIVFINDKYVYNQYAKTHVCIIKYFIAMIIEVGG